MMKFLLLSYSRLKRWHCTGAQLVIFLASVIGLTLVTLPRALLVQEIQNGGPNYSATPIQVTNESDGMKFATSKAQTKTTAVISPIPEAANSSSRSPNRLTEYHSTLPVTDADIQESLKILDDEILQKRTANGLAVSQTPSYWNTELLRKQVLIVTSWRSGSTFLAEILATHPLVFHHYEPLVYAGTNQIRSGPMAAEAVQHLSDLFKCKFRNRKYQHLLASKSKYLLGRNVQLWNTCLQSTNQNTCSDPKFLEQACHRFPVVLVKTVRLRLVLTLSLLADEQLRDLRIVYLVRDPRATMNSRYRLAYWCKSEDCIEPTQLCNDISSDLTALQMISSQFPGRLKLLKYEQLSEDPHKTFDELFRFLELDSLASVKDAITRHTSDEVDNNGPWGTFHNSSQRIDLWKQMLTRKQTDDIQVKCADALNRMNYQLV